MEEVKPEEKGFEDPAVPKKKSRPFRRFLYAVIFFGSVALAMEYMKASNTSLTYFKKQPESEPKFLDESAKDAEMAKRGQEERIKKIRESIQQELVHDHHISGDEFQSKVMRKKIEIAKELENILKLSEIKGDEKYHNVIENFAQEVKAMNIKQSAKKEEIEKQLEKLENIRLKIEAEINALEIYFEKKDKNVKQYRDEQLTSFKDTLNNFLKEFNQVKTENESTAFSYLDKMKELIEEGEEHIKEIDAKIPKDLKEVREDIRERYSKLKFMIKEYYRDHQGTSETFEFVKNYLDKSSQALQRLKHMNIVTDKESDIKTLEDEKQILITMINKMKQEIKGTQEDFRHRVERLQKIHKLSEKNMLNLLEYHNKLEALCIQMDNAAMKGGDISTDLNYIMNYTTKEDELIEAICLDLLSEPETSTKVVTSNEIEKHFRDKRYATYRK